MEMKNILRIIFLLLAIVYGFSNTIKAVRGQRIGSIAVWLMAIGIVGFIAIQFDWVNL